jgi:hypothetical protein
LDDGLNLPLRGNAMCAVFEHHLEAQRFADSLTELPARAALRAIHHLLLEASGLTLQFLPERYHPIQPLDLRFFYQTVERLFEEWTEQIRRRPEAAGNRERLLQLSEAEALLPTLPTKRARIGLINYLAILLATPIPAGTFVDALFCSRLVAVLLASPEAIDGILHAKPEDEIMHWDD